MSYIKAIVLRTIEAKGGLLIFPSLTDAYGRISLATYKNKGGLINPYSLIEAEISRLDGDLAFVQGISVLDTFPDARGESRAKSLLFLRMILEHCLPTRAPSKAAFEMTESLLMSLSLFRDWKAAPWLLSCLFFEQEGISLESFLSLPKLHEESKQKASKLFSGEHTEWGELEIPDDLFQATLELIGINKVCERGDLNPHEETLTTTSK
jgi:hypothetical protein